MLLLPLTQAGRDVLAHIVALKVGRPEYEKEREELEAVLWELKNGPTMKAYDHESGVTVYSEHNLLEYSDEYHAG